MSKNNATVTIVEQPPLDGQVNPRTNKPGRPNNVEHGRGNRSDRRFGFPWILPAMIVSVGVLYYCIGYTGYISTLNWDGASPEPVPVGAQNYTRLFQDPVFWKSVAHTGIFFVVTFTVQVGLGMFFAILLHSKVRLGVLYKVLIFIPVVLAPATMSPVFRQIYAPDGQLNGVIRALGFHDFSYAWLADQNTALIAVMSAAIWQSTGVVFVLYYAAMSQIETELMEAARLDGAGNFRIIRSIIWPGVRGTTLAIAILTAIGSLKTFDWPFLITQGGPSYATEFLGTQIYRVSVALSQVGYGAALSIVLLVLALGVAIILNLAGKEKGAPRV
jgi:ABC-type sugar transport system permease subunit